MTAATEFYDYLRGVLGDIDPLGNYQFQDADLLRAVRGVFRVGRGPDDFVYDYDADTITPTLPDGDSFAVVLYRAARYLAGGMDGAIMYRTRALAVTDRGNKKRDLLRELEIEIHKIEGGECVWAAKQAFDTFFHALRDGSISDAMTDVDVSGARTVSINVP